MAWRKEIQGLESNNAVTAVGAILLLLSFYKTSYWFIFLGAFLLVISRMSIYYLNHVADHLIFENEKESIRLSVGEEIILPLKFSQSSWLPIFQGTLKIKLEAIVEGLGVPFTSHENNVEFKFPIFVKGQETIQVSLPLKATARGVTRIKTVELTVGNFFGLGSVQLKYNPFIHKELIVYPSPTMVSQTDRLVAARSNGDYSSPSSMFEQFLAPIGTRDYVYTDSFKQIHWKASAKTQALQTKVFERMADNSWTFIINLREANTPHIHLGVVENLESIASNVAYLAQLATQRGIEFEVFLNLRMVNQSAVYHLPKGCGTRQLGKVLDILARVNKKGNTQPLNKLLHYVEKKQQNSPVVIFCGPFLDEKHKYIAQMLKNGQRLFILQDDNQYPAIVPLGRI